MDRTELSGRLVRPNVKPVQTENAYLGGKKYFPILDTRLSEESEPWWGILIKSRPLSFSSLISLIFPFSLSPPK